MSVTTHERVRNVGISWQALAALFAGVLVVFYVLPLAGLVITQSPDQLFARITTPRALSAAATSLLTASVTTVLAVAFGLPLAYWLARTDSWLETPVLALVVLPLVMPPVVSGMLLLSVVGPNGIGGVASAFGLPLSRSLAGVVVAQMFVASPLFVVIARAAFVQVDDDLESAARTLGVGPAGTLQRVTLPLARGGLVAGVTLTFARAIGEFGATLMVAYYPRTLPVEIWATFYASGLAESFALTLFLLGISVVALTVIIRVGTSPWR